MAMFRAEAHPSELPSTGIAHEVRSATTVEGVAKARHADPVYLASAYAVVAVAVVIAAIMLALRNPSLPVAVAGVNVFASLYVAAQAIERTLEPLREWLGDPLNKIASPTEANAAGEETKSRRGASKSDLQYVRSLAIKSAREKAAAAAAPGSDDATKAAAQRAADVAAAAQAAVEEERANSALVMWALASFLGILIAGWVGLGLLHTVGVLGAPRLVDVVVTGLAIGGGTKPLHDLISNLQSAKESESDPADVKAS